MAAVLVTVDTELSAGRQASGWGARDNFRSSFLGRCGRGDFGVPWLLDRLDAAGLTGVFFVDPMPALVHGEGVVADMVGPIVERGHEVQIHIHTEWLEWARASPVGGRTGRNIGDFTVDDQVTLIRHARDLLMRAGAPRPVAFRAGNYGADDRTLVALDRLGIAWDASFNADYAGARCAISPPASPITPERRGGVMLAPVSGLFDRPGHFRPAQVCAMSAREMRAALDHAARHAHPCFTIVSHSFEMLSRDRARPNRTVMRRFDALCTHVADSTLRSEGFRTLPARAPRRRLAPAAHSYPRTAARVAEQMLAAWRYERSLRPA
jgi:hypothetical protein